MKRNILISIYRYFNVQKIAGLFFILLIVTAYSITFRHYNPIESPKQKLISVVKNHQEKGISTLAITSLPFWLAVKDRLTGEEK